jgi:hypothetical protein
VTSETKQVQLQAEQSRSVGIVRRQRRPHCFGQRGLRCPLLRPAPAQRPRIVEIHDNLLGRIAEAEQEGWAGEVEGLKVSLAGARQKLAQLDEMTQRATTIHLGIPAFRYIAGRDIAGEEPS